MIVLRSALTLALAQASQDLAFERRERELERGYHKHYVEVLQGQIADLRRLVFAPAHEVPEDHREADLILTQNHEMPLSADEQNEILREQSGLLSGSWDEVI